MAKKSDSWTPPFLRQRALITGEAVLLVGLAQELVQRWLLHQQLPNWGRVLVIMGSALGLIGALLFLQTVATSSVAKTHQLARALPVGGLVLHAAAYAGLFWVYAVVWQLTPLFAY